MLTGAVTNRRSNAKNAYDLMSDIAAYILEEPKRVWMGDWIIQGHQNIEDALETKGPECGTVGCIAGNALLLTGQAVSSKSDVWGKACDILSGGDDDLDSELGTLFLHTNVEADYGTKEYAQIVATRIREFQYEHEDRLRTVKVTPVKPSTKEGRE